MPVVALDGSAAGLSADGSTLVLIKPRVAFPRARTTFVVVAATELRVRERVTLKGDFSYDALSPDGRSLYLIEYTSRTDPTRYRVRLYDVPSEQLLPEPVVDPREPDERMRGYPITRATSPDGRWEYTLYDGAGHAPFVHALDTGAAVRCVHRRGRAGGRADPTSTSFGSRSAQDGRIVSVTGRDEPLVLIDAETFRCLRAARGGAARGRATGCGEGDGNAGGGGGTSCSTRRRDSRAGLLGALWPASGCSLVVGRRRRRVVPTSTS